MGEIGPGDTEEHVLPCRPVVVGKRSRWSSLRGGVLLIAVDAEAFAQHPPTAWCCAGQVTHLSQPIRCCVRILSKCYVDACSLVKGSSAFCVRLAFHHVKGRLHFFEGLYERPISPVI